MTSVTTFRLILLTSGLATVFVACYVESWHVLAAGGLCVYSACHWRE